MFSKRKWITVLASTAAITILATAALSDDFNPQPDPPAFAPDGILPGETARLAVYCARVFPGVATRACTVTFEFEDLAGQMLKTETKTIAAGQGGYLEYAVPAVQRTERVEIIPCIKVRGRGLAVTASVEVYETATGKTRYHADAMAPSAHMLIGLL